MTYTSTSSSLAHVVSDSLKNIQVTHSKVAMSYNAVSINVFFPLNLVRETFTEKTGRSSLFGLYTSVCIDLKMIDQIY